MVGKALLPKLLSQGHEITCLVRPSGPLASPLPGLRWIPADLQSPIDPKTLQGIETVYHCAAEIKNRDKMYAVNVEGTKHLLKAAVGAGVQRWIQLSSVGVYGPPRNDPMDEQTQPAPSGLYERTKWAADRLVTDVCGQAGMDYVLLRPSNIVGPGMKNRSFTPLVQALRQRRFFYIGPRDAVATYIHVKDVVQAMIRCQEAVSGRVFNLSSDCLWEALIRRIATLVGRPPPHWRLPEFPLRTIIRIFEGKIWLPLSLRQLDILTRRAGYPADRIIQELDFTFTKPMPEGIDDVV